MTSNRSSTVSRLSRALASGVWIVAIVVRCAIGDGSPTSTLVVRPPLISPPATRLSHTDVLASPSLVSVQGMRTNEEDYPGSQVPQYGKLEISFDLTGMTATNPYYPYDENAPTGIESATGITVDALLLPPGETGWQQALRLPCFYYQPVEEVGAGEDVALLPVGDAEWHCRFSPQTPGTWTYKIQATDAGGTSESSVGSFSCARSDRPGFITVSQMDPRFFAFADGTPFATPLVNVEEGSPFNDLAAIRRNVPLLGKHGVRFIRWFPTGEGANYAVAPFADSIRINWAFGDSAVTTDDADLAEGRSFSYAPYYYSAQRIPAVPGSRYRLSLRAKVAGDRVLRLQVEGLGGASADICSNSSTYHQSTGGTCTYKQDGWQDYALEVETTGSTPDVLTVALHGLYVSGDAPSPYHVPQAGTLRVHSVRFQRDETGSGGWGPNLLTRSDPDTFRYVDQRAAAQLDEILHLSERVGVYHKLTLFHKNDELLARLQLDGTFGDWDVDHFYGAPASRWYQEAYARYFVARWSYSPALHSLELANENNFDGQALDAAFDIAETILDLSPRHILMSNSFWGWWVEDFWTDPARGHLMDYSDQHWYANLDGAFCNVTGSNCTLISNVWADSAAYVRECWTRFRKYSQDYDYDKPIVRGEGGVASAGTDPQHPDIATDPTGTYYHKKLWAHMGLLGYSCDGEWYPRLFVAYADGSFPNSARDLGRIFAAYERFVAGEPLANGQYVEIGTDLDGSERVAVTLAAGNVRAWGVRDSLSGMALLWIDNADHTWKNVVDGLPMPVASATLTVPGLRAGGAYQVEWWDPYADNPASQILRVVPAIAAADGSIALAVDNLATDIAIKIYPGEASYLPVVLNHP